MKVYCIIYPKDCSDPASHNQMWDNIGELRCRRSNDGAVIVLSDLSEVEFAKRIFAGVSPEYDAISFLVADSTMSPEDLHSQPLAQINRSDAHT
jgi:hypothetical protein